MQEVSFVTPLHIASKRNYLERMTAEKPECMRVAKQYGADYWDGDRKYGYGGYKYDGRWRPVAKAMVEHYGLWFGDTILDIGCGKGHLLHEFTQIRNFGGINGIDISEHALIEAPDLHGRLFIRDCVDLHGLKDRYYDFAYSINVFHNLGYKDLKSAIREMVRVTKPGGNSYICVESFRNEEELCNLQCWALTCQSFYSPEDWKCILEDNGYTGDVEFIYFT